MKPALTLRRTRHDWPSYVMQGRQCVAWLWGKLAVERFKKLLK